MADEININRTSSEDGYDEFLNILSAAPSKEVDNNDNQEPPPIVNEPIVEPPLTVGEDQSIREQLAADESSVNEAIMGEPNNDNDWVNISTGEPWASQSTCCVLFDSWIGASWLAASSFEEGAALLLPLFDISLNAYV